MPGLLLSILLAVGQTSAPAADPLSALADPIVDTAHGFSIRPPKDWQYLRQRVPERRGSTLVRMVNPLTAAEPEEIVLKHSNTTRAVSMGAMLRSIAANIELEHGDVAFLSQQEQQIAGRPGGILAATFAREGRSRVRLQAIIEAQPRNYFVLIYEGPAARRENCELLFNHVLSSFELQSALADRETLATAAHEGRALLDAITPDSLRKAIIPKQVLKFVLDGTTVGYVVVRQTEMRRDDRPGVSVSESGWIFEADGGARRLRSEMWVSLDVREEKWETHVTNLLPASRGQKPRLDSAIEKGQLADGILLTSQKDPANQRVTENPPVRVARNYLPRALVRMLPALVSAPENPRTLAFVSFDHARAELVPRIIDLKGAARLPGATADETAFRLDDREGTAAPPSALYFDKDGKTLLVEARSLRMLPATIREMENCFAARITEAGVIMDDLERNARFEGRNP